MLLALAGKQNWRWSAAKRINVSSSFQSAHTCTWPLKSAVRINIWNLQGRHDLPGPSCGATELRHLTDCFTCYGVLGMTHDLLFDSIFVKYISCTIYCKYCSLWHIVTVYDVVIFIPSLTRPLPGLPETDVFVVDLGFLNETQAAQRADLRWIEMTHAVTPIFRICFFVDWENRYFICSLHFDTPDFDLQMCFSLRWDSRWHLTVHCGLGENSSCQRPPMQMSL